MSNFKLINFFEHVEFNMLRFDMNAPLIPSFTSGKINLIDEDFIRRLGKEGIDIDDFSQIKKESDGTLTYQNKRVLVYIRDIKEYNEQQSLPKFHLAFCSTLETMTQASRFGRYVVYNGDDSNFTVNFIGSPTRPDVKKLDVCKHCLALLRWNNYSARASQQFKEEIVRNFKIPDFFAKYPKDLLSIIPTYTADNAPLNDYSGDWGMFSERFKQQRGYICESCGLQLTGSNRRFLDGHHKDGNKANNIPNNIEILCVGCHANQPLHEHMKASSRYKEFSDIFGVKENVVELDEVLYFSQSDSRVCPQPQEWNRFWELMHIDNLKPSPPLILAAWHHTSDEEKINRFASQIRWAAEHGLLVKAHTFIKALKDEHWHYEN